MNMLERRFKITLKDFETNEEQEIIALYWAPTARGFYYRDIKGEDHDIDLMMSNFSFYAVDEIYVKTTFDEIWDRRNGFHGLLKAK